MLVMRADIFGYALQCADESVGLFIVAAVKDLSSEVGFVSFKLGGRLSLWAIGLTTTSTATLSLSTRVGTSRSRASRRRHIDVKLSWIDGV
jgi:hypothetical protein